MVKHYNKQPLKELLKMSEKLIRLTADDFDYQLICDELHTLSGAKLTLINLIDESRAKAETVAISGVNETISQVVEHIGFQLEGAKWDIAPSRIGDLKGGELKVFNSLDEASAGNISRPMAAILEKTCNLGKTYAVEITDAEGKNIGEAAIIMGRGDEIQNPEAVEIYASQIGLLLMRIESEKNLKESEAKYKLLTENANDVIWIMDMEMNYSYISPAVERLSGFDIDELTSKGIDQILTPDSYQKILQLFQEEITKVNRGDRVPGRFFTLELEQIRKDGSVVWVEVKTVIIRDDAGNPVGVMGITRDINERKMAENALLKEKHEKELILENLSEQVSYMDKDMRLVWANRCVCERHGISREDYLGRQCFELFHGFSKPCLGCTVPEAINKGRVVTGEVVSPDGLFWKLTSTPVFKESEGLTGVLHFASDVTDLKASEAELKKLNLELEKRVEARTAELKSVIKELDAFTYSVSHDLRAPLRSIEGFSRAILEDHDENFDPEGKRYFKRILAATDRMKNLIDDLLKLSRVTRHELNRKKVDLSRLADIHVKEMREKEPKRNVRVVIEPDIYVFGDQALLEIALVNLLENAWKYTRDIEDATIKFGSQNNNEGIICFIQDTGVGFDQAYADKLFSPFQRLHSHEHYPGTGIGLSIVSRVISRHGGKVWAESEIGQGATFFFQLPQEIKPD